MNSQVKLFRQVMLRLKDRPQEVVTLREPIVRNIHVAVLDGRGFGQEVYTWDGKETTVRGLPVYRW